MSRSPKTAFMAGLCWSLGLQCTLVVLEVSVNQCLHGVAYTIPSHLASKYLIVVSRYRIHCECRLLSILSS